MNDPRNLTDEFKHQSIDTIVKELDKRGVELEIAIENTLRDFNMGSIVRSANAFGVRHIHVIGRRQWNKRGAMATDKYLHIHYHDAIEEFATEMSQRQKRIFAVDNITGSIPLTKSPLPTNCVMVFGQEGPGISKRMLSLCESVIAIEQYGSTRSLNVGVAAGIAMYAWLVQNRLQ